MKKNCSVLSNEVKINKSPNRFKQQGYAKPFMEYLALPCKSALHPNKHRMPCAWDLNIYRGCEHGCRYCYALYSHDYLNDSDRRFFDRVYYKSNIAQVLEKELSAKSWKHEAVNIGGVTDSYQPLEEQLQIMPEILKVLIKHKTPAIIATKSNLILRDLDYLCELSTVADLKVSLTITTMDESLQRQLEPRATSPQRRMTALKKLVDSGISAGITLMPVIPHLTDSYENLEAIYQSASAAGVEYIRSHLLYLIGKTRGSFLSFLNTYDEQIYRQVKDLYRTQDPPAAYRREFYAKMRSLREKYQIPGWSSLKMPENSSLQTSLLDFRGI